MNEKLQYAEMLEIPQSTVNITYKRVKPKKFAFKRKKKQTDEEIKNSLLEKVNSETLGENSDPVAETFMSAETTEDVALQTEEPTAEEGAGVNEEVYENPDSTVTIRPKKAKRRGKVNFKFNVITAQLVIIGALIATIFLTNALVPGSGINTFLQGVFGTNQQTTAVSYEDYSPSVPVKDVSGISVENGVMTLSGEGSVYPPCDGKVTSVTETNGKYDIVVEHSEKFKTVFSGVDFAYVSAGESVYKTIPVGYMKGENVSVCFYDGDSMITDYTVSENTVVWAA